MTSTISQRLPPDCRFEFSSEACASDNLHDNPITTQGGNLITLG